MDERNLLWVLPISGAVAMAVILLGAKSGFDPPTKEDIGKWNSIDWGFGADNAALLANGHVAVWDTPSWCDGTTERLWKVGADGKSGSFTLVPAPSQHSNNCVGYSFLSDGRLLIVGGSSGCSGLDQATIFDWTKVDGAPWSKVTPMHKSRWYPSATTLGDGRVLVTLGNIANGNGSLREPFPEIYNPATNSWQLLWNAPFPGCPCDLDESHQVWVCGDCPSRCRPTRRCFS